MFDPAAWIAACDEERVKRLAVEHELLDAVPTAPEPDRADTSASLIDAFIADLELARAVQAEQLVDVRLMVAPTATDRAEVQQVRTRTDAAITGWRVATTATDPIGSKDFADAVQGQDERLGELAARRAAVDARTVSISDLVLTLQRSLWSDGRHQPRLLAAWHAGSVPQLRTMLAVDNLATSMTATTAAIALGLVRTVTQEKIPGGVVVIPAELESARLERQDFDAVATGQQKQAARDAEAAGTQVLQWLNELHLGQTPVDAGALHAAAAAWLDIEWHMILDLARAPVPIGPSSPSAPGTTSSGTAVAVIGSTTPIVPPTTAP